MANSTATNRKLLPPYIPARTFMTFLDHLRDIGGMPSHIDKAVMSNMSGGIQSWLKASLRYMKLMNAEDEPTEMLARLVQAQGEDRKALLRELFESTYSFLNGRIDLQNTTPQKLRSAIIEMGAQGETVEKIMSFMIGLGKEAGVPLSPYLTKRATGQRRLRQRIPRKGPAGAVSPLNPSPESRNGESVEVPSMKTVLLPKAGGKLTLSGSFNLFDLAGDERELVFALIDKMNEFAAKHGGGDDD
jgi:hypothetical protein